MQKEAGKVNEAAENRKRIKRVIYVAAFLFLSIFYILPYLTYTSIYFHEKAHKDVLESYGIKAEHKPDWIWVIPNFYSRVFGIEKSELAITTFNLNEVKKLNPVQIKEIYTAGIISDLRFMLLLSVYLIFINLFLLFKKPKAQFDKYVLLILVIDWIIFMWILVLVSSTISNLSYTEGDIGKLVSLLS